MGDRDDVPRGDIALAELNDIIDWEALVDVAIVCFHEHAAGAAKTVFTSLRYSPRVLHSMALAPGSACTWHHPQNGNPHY